MVKTKYFGNVLEDQLHELSGQPNISISSQMDLKIVSMEKMSYQNTIITAAVLMFDVIVFDVQLTNQHV